MFLDENDLIFQVSEVSELNVFIFFNFITNIRPVYIRGGMNENNTVSGSTLLTTFFLKNIVNFLYFFFAVVQPLRPLVYRASKKVIFL